MKKSVLLLAAAFGVSGAFAQDLTSKKGEPFLPEAGDWSIGIDAAPFLNYAGQLLSNGGATAPGFNFLTGNTQTIVGKMFKDEKTAYRAGLRIGLGSDTKKMMNADRASTAVLVYPAVGAEKENTWKSSTTAIGLSGGLEFRRGKTRLQGYYGGELGFYMKSTKDKFTYGNALSNSTTLPVSVTAADDFGTIGGVGSYAADNLGTDTYGNASRVTERKNGSMISLGLRGFIGAEYFILPKISIAGEFGWGLGLTSNGKSTTTIESLGFTTANVIGSQVSESGKSGSFRIDTDNKNSVWGPTSTLRLNLHF